MRIQRAGLAINVWPECMPGNGENFFVRDSQLAPARSTPMQIATDASRSCQPFVGFAIKFPRSSSASTGPRPGEKQVGHDRYATPASSLSCLTWSKPSALHGLSTGLRDKAHNVMSTHDNIFECPSPNITLEWTIKLKFQKHISRNLYR